MNAPAGLSTLNALLSMPAGSGCYYEHETGSKECTQHDPDCGTCFSRGCNALFLVAPTMPTAAIAPKVAQQTAASIPGGLFDANRNQRDETAQAALPLGG